MRFNLRSATIFRCYVPLAEEIGEGDVLEETVDDGLSLESGGGLLDLSDHVVW